MDIIKQHELWDKSNGRKGSRLVWARLSDEQKKDMVRLDLRGVNLSCADLRGANLSSTDFRDINLSFADLSGADLNYSNLGWANLHGVNLSGAILSDADLGEAKLHGADLRGADLSGADLCNTDLRNAKLSGANLRGAYLSGADLSWADLRGANLIVLYLPIWTVYVYAGYIRIGCKYYSYEDWEQVSDKEINRMDDKALNWWRQHKKLIFAAVDSLKSHK